jgi:hypothetical protein
MTKIERQDERDKSVYKDRQADILRGSETIRKRMSRR